MDTGIIDKQRTGWTSIIQAHTRIKERRAAETRAYDAPQSGIGLAAETAENARDEEKPIVVTRFDRAAGSAKQIYLDENNSPPPTPASGTHTALRAREDPSDLAFERYNNAVITARARRERFKAVAFRYDTRNIWEILRDKFGQARHSVAAYMRSIFR